MLWQGCMHSKGVNTLLTVATMAAKMLMKVYYYGYVYIIPIECLTVTCVIKQES